MPDKTPVDQKVVQNKPKSIWDNDLPAGDSPKLPRWPLTAAILAFSFWLVFLISMAVLRVHGN